ncbi:histidinol-phosphatase [Microbacterium halimionae]|uniref:Histidinol-phosphatase n=1 Tax=Microbacterium halimionae TaxID=1526413 RepID=A0A7W3JR05_9MICO|nr:inositol monophosphatase family protein [Microbacterium halimionae]MBA8817386.1 histidinol-phosphatase [Microbacterium halimionae]NII96020.1 histidinol-phosphatase [Microbacterium halimionae]
MTPGNPALDFASPFDGDLQDDLRLALKLADAADSVTMAKFDTPDLDISTKADATHVTEADLAAEQAIRALLETERPNDGVFGEEFGITGDSNRQWIIDPIDGTANYLKGIPMWTTLIALAIDGVPRVGVVSQPAIGRRWWAATNLGAWTNTDTEPRRLKVSDVDTVAEASFSFQSIDQWDDAGHLESLIHLTRSVWRDRGYGDAWPYMLLAEGRLELVAEFDVKEYDIAAIVPIIIEAGGAFTAYSGTHTLSERSSFASNGVLHDALLNVAHNAPLTVHAESA